MSFEEKLKCEVVELNVQGVFTTVFTNLTPSKAMSCTAQVGLDMLYS